MRLASFVGGLSLVAQCSLALPAVTIPSLEEAAAALEKRDSTFAITGVTGSTYPRLEVREMFWNKPNQWTLLILAMQAFQAQDQSSATSYYQISGIHGVPRVDWDGVGQCSSCGDADGYCPHDSVLFPAWHRVYVALFEQQFMTVVNQIALSFPSDQQPAMLGAASTMRFPFWDWAAQPRPGYPTLPTIVSEKYITINGPSGSETIINPLFRHDFADASQLVYYPFTSWGVTLRYPNSDAATASSDEANCTSAFDNIRSSLQDQLYQLFSTCTDYLHFSNDDAGSSSTSCSNSLEGIHNTVHTTAGGPGSSSIEGGHMTYLSLAAFDPIFWLHHCNVDRLFAMWQTLNPDSYGGSQTAPHDTWFIAAGSTQDQNSPLAPFHSDTVGTFWTTEMVQNWSSTFQYTYPEFADSDGSSSAIASYVNVLYGPSATATAGSSKRTAAPEPAAAPEAVPTAEPDLYRAPLASRQIANALTALNGSMFQYVANIKTPRYALNGSYYIYLFDGNPASETPSSWLTDSALIGPMGVLAQPDMTHHDTTAAGSIPLTRCLTSSIHNGIISDLSEAVVTPYLKSNLQWRIAQNGTEIDPATIPTFEIAVFASTATQASEYALPMWSAFVPLLDVTQGQAGGANTTANATATR